MPPEEIRALELLARWTVPTPPDRTAACIARDLESEFNRMFTARVTPGQKLGTYEVLQILHVSLIIDQYRDLRGIFTVEPDGKGGSAISWRQVPSTSPVRENETVKPADSYIKRMSNLGRKCWWLFS